MPWRAIAGLLAVMWAGPAVAQAAGYDAALSACRTAAEAAEDYDPTTFECEWTTLAKGTPRGALTGRFIYQRQGITGGMTILEGGGPALVAVNTVTTRTANSCTAQLRGDRNGGDVLLLQSTTEKSCILRIRSTGRSTIAVAASGCANACGLDATMDGVYRRVGP